MNNKLYKKLLWGIGVVIVAVILTLFIVSRTYIQNLVYLSLIHILCIRDRSRRPSATSWSCC